MRRVGNQDGYRPRRPAEDEKGTQIVRTPGGEQQVSTLSQLADNPNSIGVASDLWVVENPEKGNISNSELP